MTSMGTSRKSSLQLMRWKRWLAHSAQTRARGLLTLTLSAVLTGHGSWPGRCLRMRWLISLQSPFPDSRDYETVAGFVISQFGRIPATGESAIVDGWRFEIVDLDGRRVDKVLATRSEKRDERAFRSTT